MTPLESWHCTAVQQCQYDTRPHQTEEQIAEWMSNKACPCLSRVYIISHHLGSSLVTYHELHNFTMELCFCTENEKRTAFILITTLLVAEGSSVRSAVVMHFRSNFPAARHTMRPKALATTLL